MDTTIALLTANEAKELVTSADPGLVDMLLDAVSADFARTCRRSFLLAAYTERYDGNCRDRLVLRVCPVKAITSIKVDGVVLNAAIYVLDVRSGIVRLTDGSVFTPGILNVEVVYQAGFETIPHDLKLAAKTAISFLVTQKTRIGIKSVTTPDQVTEYVDGKYPKLVTDILEKYTLRRVA